jgi:hypothetical protein
MISECRATNNVELILMAISLIFVCLLYYLTDFSSESQESSDNSLSSESAFLRTTPVIEISEHVNFFLICIILEAYGFFNILVGDISS